MMKKDLLKKLSPRPAEVRRYHVESSPDQDDSSVVTPGDLGDSCKGGVALKSLETNVLKSMRPFACPADCQLIAPFVTAVTAVLPHPKLILANKNAGGNRITESGPLFFRVTQFVILAGK